MALVEMNFASGVGGNAPKMDRFTLSSSNFHTTNCDFTVKEVIMSTNAGGYFAVVKYDVENNVIYQSLNGNDFTINTSWNGYFTCSGNTISVKGVNSNWDNIPVCLIASDQHFD